MALHVAEVYAALVAQRRQIFAALQEAAPDRLVEEIGLDHGSVLGTLAHVAREEQRVLEHVLRRRPELSEAGFRRIYLGDELTLASVERGWERIDFQVLDWNPARKFYHRLGMGHLGEWLRYGADEAALRRLAKEDK